jgi:hypothetical protein
MRGQFVEMPTPVVITPMICPNPECGHPMIEVTEKPDSNIEIPDIRIARR